MNDPVISFLPLARMILGDGYDGCTHERWVRPLAQLLEAASRGEGQLPLSVCPIDRDAPPEIFALVNDTVLLRRTASHWDEVRGYVELLYHSKTHRLADAAVRDALSAILPSRQEHANDGRLVFDNSDQRFAVAMFVDSRVGVITGGPGTGKTTTAAALLAIRKRLDPALSARDVLLCAPTGKAACRLADSVGEAASRLTLEPSERHFLRELLPQTIHRALEWSPIPPEQGGPFRRGPNRPLRQRLVLVDEASMVDLALMTQLLRAIASETSLILLGDSDQLESVEAGGVLGELVSRGTAVELLPSQRTTLAARLGGDPDASARTTTLTNGDVQGLPGLAVSLRHSYRAKRSPWILELCSITKPGSRGNAAAFLACCDSWFPQIRLLRRRRDIFSLCQDRWQELREAARDWSMKNPPSTSALVEQLKHFQLLCADNAQVGRANQLGLTTLSVAPTGKSGPVLPHGCPVMITENAPALALANGDVGIALCAGLGTAAQVVAFPDSAALIPIAQLPNHQPAFALTIHKSQGSEWREVAIEFPDEGEHLDRNLLYTAISRASGSLTICVPNDQILEGILGE